MDVREMHFLRCMNTILLYLTVFPLTPNCNKICFFLGTYIYTVYNRTSTSQKVYLYIGIRRRYIHDGIITRYTHAQMPRAECL